MRRQWNYNTMYRKFSIFSTRIYCMRMWENGHCMFLWQCAVGAAYPANSALPLKRCFWFLAVLKLLHLARQHLTWRSITMIRTTLSVLFLAECNLSLHCCSCSTDDLNLIIYIVIAVAAAVVIAAVAVVIFFVMWRASSAAKARVRPGISASPATVSSRPMLVVPPLHNRVAPPHLRSGSCSGCHTNGYHNNECSAQHPHSRCFHSKINVSSDPFPPFWSPFFTAKCKTLLITRLM